MDVEGFRPMSQRQICKLALFTQSEWSASRTSRTEQINVLGDIQQQLLAENCRSGHIGKNRSLK